MPTLCEAEIRENVSYDPETGVFSWLKKGRGRTFNKEAGSIVQGYRMLCINRKLYKAHNLAWFLHYGEWPTMLVDHINRKPADNRICNLRLVTASQNQRNKSGSRFSFSSYKGVCYEANRKKWKASIRIDGKGINLGRFKSVFEAAEAYDEAAKSYFGEYAALNFPWRNEHADYVANAAFKV